MIRIFWLHSLFFTLEKQPKNLNFHSCFVSKRLEVTFSETCALNSKKCVSEPNMTIPDLSEKFWLFWLQSNNTNFQFLFSKIIFGGYF